MKNAILVTALVLAASAAQAKDIVETAVAAGDFKTLAAALQKADLVQTLKGKGPFTVLAPTDAAFAKVPKKDLDALLADKDKLAAVLTYHVVPGNVMAKDVKAGKVKTVQGSDLTLSTANGVKEVTEIQIGLDGVVLATARGTTISGISQRDLYLAIAKTPFGKPNKARTWKDVNAKLPALPIRVYGPPSTSGTRGRDGTAAPSALGYVTGSPAVVISCSTRTTCAAVPPRLPAGADLSFTAVTGLPVRFYLPPMVTEGFLPEAHR